MLVAIIITLLVILIIQFLHRNHKINKRLKGFVSPPGLPLLRHFFIFNSELGFLPNLCDTLSKYGGLLKLEMLYGMPVLVVTDKDLIGHILCTKAILIKDSFYQFCESWLGQGLVTCHPTKWKKTRKIINPAFNTQTLEAHIESFEFPSKILIEKLKAEAQNDGFEVLPYVKSCTMDIIGETLMGIKLNTQLDENSKYLEDIEEITAIIIRRLFSPFKRNPLLYMLSRDYWKELEVVTRIRDLTQKVIDSRRKHRSGLQTNGVCSNGITKKKTNMSFLDLLLDAEYDGRPMTDVELIDETQSFLFAGLDTSATTVSLCLYCLSRNPDVQDKVMEELECVFGNDRRSPTPHDLSELRYLDMVIKETLRLYSTIPFISRLLEEDIDFGDIFIPKGFSVLIFIYGVHMNKEYHPDPDTFNPSRFETDVTPHTFLPFGLGPRNCIGQRFGTLATKYLLCQILRNFKVLPVVGHVPQKAALILLRFKNGTMIRLQER